MSYFPRPGLRDFNPNKMTPQEYLDQMYLDFDIEYEKSLQVMIFPFPITNYPLNNLFKKSFEFTDFFNLDFYHESILLTCMITLLSYNRHYVYPSMT